MSVITKAFTQDDHFDETSSFTVLCPSLLRLRHKMKRSNKLLTDLHYDRSEYYFQQTSIPYAVPFCVFGNFPLTHRTGGSLGSEGNKYGNLDLVRILNKIPYFPSSLLRHCQDPDLEVLRITEGEDVVNFRNRWYILQTDSIISSIPSWCIYFQCLSDVSLFHSGSVGSQGRLRWGSVVGRFKSVYS